MTKEEFRQIEYDSDFRNACIMLMQDVDEITTEDKLISFARKMMDENMIFLAAHILQSVCQYCPTELWRYDTSMGTLNTPTPINEFDDIEDLLEED